jgi:hypothetical protein
MERQSFVHKPPDWHGLRAIWPILPSLPAEFYGFELSWPDSLEVPPVFISQYELSGCFGIVPKSKLNTNVYLFGFRINFDDVTSVPRELAGGHVIEFTVIEYRSDGSFTQHHLKQRESVTYSSFSEPQDYRISAEMTESQRRYAGPCPLWKETEAYWPFSDSDPMIFVGQALWGDFNYVFVAEKNDRLIFKVTTQPTDIQTAEEHYQEEAQ